MERKCVILSAPSGAGKTTIVKYLLSQFEKLSFSISATSRAPRPGELDGKHYYFLTASAFQQRIDRGEFLEWEAVYPGCYYGTLRSEIERVWLAKKNLIFDVDVVGGCNLKKHFRNQALAIFVSPPNLAILEERLRARSTETETQLKGRIAKAESEMAYSDKFDKILINDDLDKTCGEAHKLVATFLKS